MIFWQQYKYQILLSTIFLLLTFPLVSFAFVEFLTQVLFSLVVTITGMFLWLGGLVLDYGINVFVIGFGELYTSSFGVAVDTVWYTIRDFMNLLFIFGLVYIGFRMILNSDNNNTRRWLVNLILAALLVNFSLFITKFTIDFTNQLATEIAVNGFAGEEGGSTLGDSRTEFEVSMSADLLNRMGISSSFFFSPDTDEGRATSIGYIIGSGVMFLVAAFVFAAGGILLMIRFAVLCFFLVMSPFMFIGWVLPPLGDTVSMYWKAFLKRAFFAPIFFLFLYFSLQIISTMQQAKLLTGTDNTSFGSMQNSDNYSGAIANPQGLEEPSLFPFFVLTIVFLIGSLMAANKIGGDGGDKLVNLGRTTARFLGRKAGNIAGGAALRPTQRVAKWGQSAYERADANMSRTRSGRIARSLVTAGTLGLASDKNVRGGLNSIQGARVYGSETAEEMRTRKKEQHDRRTGLTKLSDNRQTLRGNEPLEINENSTQEEIEQSFVNRRKRAEAIRKMSGDQLVEQIRNGAISKSAVMAPEFAAHLSDPQIETLKKAGIFTEYEDNNELKKLKGNREEGRFGFAETVLESNQASQEHIEETLDELTKIMKSLSEEQLKNMDKKVLKKEAVAAQMSPDQLDTLKQAPGMTREDFEEIEKTREKGLIKILENGSLSKSQQLTDEFKEKQRKELFKNAKNAAKLGDQVLKHEKATQYLTPKIFENYMEELPLEKDLNDIKSNLETYMRSSEPGAKGSARAFGNWTNKTAFGKQLDLNIPNDAK